MDAFFIWAYEFADVSFAYIISDPILLDQGKVFLSTFFHYAVRDPWLVLSVSVINSMKEFSNSDFSALSVTGASDPSCKETPVFLVFLGFSCI